MIEESPEVDGSCLFAPGGSFLGPLTTEGTLGGGSLAEACLSGESAVEESPKDDGSPEEGRSCLYVPGGLFPGLLTGEGILGVGSVTEESPEDDGSPEKGGGLSLFAPSGSIPGPVTDKGTFGEGVLEGADCATTGAGVALCAGSGGLVGTGPIAEAGPNVRGGS